VCCPHANLFEFLLRHIQHFANSFPNQLNLLTVAHFDEKWRPKCSAWLFFEVGNRHQHIVCSNLQLILGHFLDPKLKVDLIRRHTSKYYRKIVVASVYFPIGRLRL